MIRLYIFLFTLLLSPAVAYCQPSTDSLHKRAKEYMRSGDYENAIIILKQASLSASENTTLMKDLALSHYFRTDYTSALDIMIPLLEQDDADDQCYLITANIYRHTDKNKEAEKTYRKGIKKFPYSGPLYNELGELLWMQKNNSQAIDEWEKGIEKDPSFSLNYYNAARYYYLMQEPLWNLLYGEIFLNLEPLNSKRTPEIKRQVLESYKKFFFLAASGKIPEGRNEFEKAFIESMHRQQESVSSGVYTESLFMVKTGFILDWYNQNLHRRFPFGLFDFNRNMIAEGYYESYIQWLFGPADNLTSFQRYTASRQTEYNEFLMFRQTKVFRMIAGQYYRK